jgi:hypothetical protein
MDSRQSKREEASAASGDHSGISVSRRRFTRAGLSGSVVLGSLASKPVLGAVPYHCTVSGQVSGNLSRAAVAGECVIGECSQYWIDGNWPSVFTKGTQPNPENCSFSGGQRIRGTNFNAYTPGTGVSPIIGAFYNSGVGASQCTVGTSTTSNPATMLQVLTTTDTSEQFVLGRVVVTSLLNAANKGSTYPVTTHSIIAMFNATFGGGAFSPVDGATWNRTRVIEYLSSLYSSGCTR